MIVNYQKRYSRYPRLMNVYLDPTA